MKKILLASLTLLLLFKSTSAQPPVIYQSPVDQVICAGAGTGVFVFTYAPTAGSAIAWQVSVDGGASWQNVTSGAVYGSSYTSNELVITNPPASMTRYQYRAIVTNSSGADTTGTVTLY